MDLIDRQEAIKALEKAGEVNYIATGGFHGIINALSVIKGLPNANPTLTQHSPKWITCSEGLPDAPLRKTGDEDFEWFESEQVLICDNDVLIHVANLVKDYIFNEIYWSATDDDELHGEEVKAWMPLPAPYKEDTE